MGVPGTSFAITSIKVLHCFCVSTASQKLTTVYCGVAMMPNYTEGTIFVVENQGVGTKARGE